jgi:predicted Zn-dependent protease
VNIAPHPGWAEAMVSMIRMRQGERDEARRILDRVIAQMPDVNVSCMSLAWATAVVGDLDGAFRWVERAIEERDTLVGFVHIYTSLLAPELASDPRYDALLARLNLSDVAR